MNTLRVIALYFVESICSAAYAQTAVQPAGQASEYGVSYTSAFESYQRFQDTPPDSWPGVNQTVNRIGGWRAYARQVQEPQTPAPTATQETPNAGTAKPMPTPQHKAANPHLHHDGGKP
jgi:hypothetical protein